MKKRIYYTKGRNVIRKLCSKLLLNIEKNMRKFIIKAIFFIKKVSGLNNKINIIT